MNQKPASAPPMWAALATPSPPAVVMEPVALPVLS